MVHKIPTPIHRASSIAQKRNKITNAPRKIGSDMDMNESHNLKKRIERKKSAIRIKKNKK